MSFKSFETSYLDCVWYELSESVAKIVKICHFTRNNQKFHFFDPKIKWIFWRGSRVPRHFKLTQLVYLCIKQILCKFQVDRTIVAPPRSDFVEISAYLGHYTFNPQINILIIFMRYELMTSVIQPLKAFYTSIWHLSL